MSTEVAITTAASTPKVRYCSRCNMEVRFTWHPGRNYFAVAHVCGEELIWRCPKAPIFTDENTTSSRRTKTMKDAQGNTIRKSEYSLAGFPATALFRWMGAKGFSFTQVAAYVDFAGIKIPVQTIKRHIIDGAHGDGKKAKSGRAIPALSEDQAKELLKFKVEQKKEETKLTKQLEKSIAEVKKSKKTAATNKSTPEIAAPAKAAPKKASSKKASK